MISKLSRRVPRVAIALFVLWMMLSPLGQFTPAQAQVAPAATTATGWAFTDMVRVGQNDFTRLVTARAGPNGMVVVYGDRGGKTGLFRIAGGTVTEVAIDETDLPGGLGRLTNLAAFGSRYEVLPNGDVLFQGSALEGSLPSPAFFAFRWSNGVISLEAPFEGFVELSQLFDHNLDHTTSNNRWLSSVSNADNTSTAYALTNGVLPTQPLFSFNRTAANCVFESAPLVAVNPNGIAAYYELQTTRQPVGTGSGSSCQFPEQRIWSINLAGGATGTVASGSAFIDGNSASGSDLALNTQNLLLNNQNHAAAIRDLYANGTSFNPNRQLVVFKPGGVETVQETSGPVETIFLADFDNTGRVLYQVFLDDGVTASLLVGPNLDTDRVLRTGDTLFTKTVTGLSLTTRPALTGAAIADGFAFVYNLDDGAIGVALAANLPPRWANPAGGAWGVAGNWNPAALPAIGDTVSFDLDATYAVDMGTRQVAGAAIQGGNVTLRRGTLTLPVGASLSVGGNRAGEVAHLTIGEPPVSPRTIVNAPLSVGFSFPGSVRIVNAIVDTPSDDDNGGYVALGFGASANVTVTSKSIWAWETLDVGIRQPSTLRIEDGARVGVLADELTVGGSVLDLPASNATASLEVDNSSNSPGPGPQASTTTLGSVASLVIGDELLGEVDISNGALAQTITTTVGVRDHGSLVDGSLNVVGVNATRTSQFEAGAGSQGGLFAATATGANASLLVSDGAVMHVNRLVLADAAQSNTDFFVSGMEPADAGVRRSTLISPLPTAAAEAAAIGDVGGCVVGRRGVARLLVSSGALVRCRQIAVGQLPGSHGILFVSGTFRSVNPRIVAEGTGALADALEKGDGVICLGRVPLCGATSGTVRGDAFLAADGELEAMIVAVGPGGRIFGNGVILASDGVVQLGGTIAPGIALLSDTQAASSMEIDAEPSAGTLTIQGNLVISPTGVLSMTVLGAAPAQQDKLVVSGVATLGGELVINFANGFLPREGDQFSFLQAGTLSGSFAKVTVTGLPPAFKFSVGSTGGGVTFTVTDDGDPNTSAGQFKTYLPTIDK